ELRAGSVGKGRGRQKVWSGSVKVRRNCRARELCNPPSRPSPARGEGESTVSTLPALVRNDPAFFEDQKQATQVVDVLQRIVCHHNQVGQLADLHSAEVSSDTTQGCGVFRSRQQGLPGRSPILDPQAHFQ